jgi:uncharacterized membrane protein
MNSPSKALYVCGLLIFLALVHMVHYYPLLPDRVADHFGFSGEANGWSPKSEFVIVYAALMLFMAVVFVGLAFLMPKFPPRTLNMTNKDYWLALERRAETYRFVTSQIIWFGNLTMAFIIATMHMTISFNLGKSVRLGIGFWVLLGGYLVLITVLSIMMIRRFAKTPKAGESYEGRSVT